MNNRKWSSVSAESRRIALMYKGGMSTCEISAALRIPRSNVRYRLVTRGVRLRTIKEAAVSFMPRVAAKLRGRRRGPHSPGTRDKMSKAHQARAERCARGFSHKPNGYVEITRGPHKGRSVHRVIMERVTGRPLTKNEVVHHVDHNRANNSPDNLVVMAASEHASLHRRKLI